MTNEEIKTLLDRMEQFTLKQLFSFIETNQRQKAQFADGELFAVRCISNALNDRAMYDAMMKQFNSGND